MSTFADSYVSSVLFADPAPGRVLSATAQRWRRLIVSSAAARRWCRVTTSLFDPYRPELHYMRGPVPKWRAKQALGAACGS